MSILPRLLCKGDIYGDIEKPVLKVSSEEIRSTKMQQTPFISVLLKDKDFLANMCIDELTALIR